MAQMNISIPDKLKAWVEQRVADGTYASISDYVRDLLRADQRHYEGGGQSVAVAAEPASPEAEDKSSSGGADPSVYSQELRRDSTKAKAKPEAGVTGTNPPKPFSLSWSGSPASATKPQMTINSRPAR